MIKNVLLVTIFVLSTFGNAQNIEFPLKHISTSEGLSQSSVIAIHQDKHGQMWFGTRDGLNKYDGNKFTIYRTISERKTSISNNDILSIIEDNEGYIWVGTYNGLNKYDPVKDKFTNYFHGNNVNSLSNNTIWALCEAFKNEIWIGTSHGLSIYNKSTNSFQNVNQKKHIASSLSGDKVLCITKSKKGDLWIGTNSGLSKLSLKAKDNYEFINYSTYKNNKIQVQVILEDVDGNLIIGTKKKGVLKFNIQNNKFEEILSNKHISSKDIRAMVYDDKGFLWIGTYDGLFVLKEDNSIVALKNKIFDTRSLSKNTIKSIFKDRKGSVWIGAYYGGLSIWDQSNMFFKSFTAISQPQGLSYDVVSAIGSYKNQLIFTTEGGGLTILNRENGSIEYINKNNTEKLPHDNLKSILVQDDNLWIGTFNSGLVLYDLSNKKIIESQASRKLNEYLYDKGVYSIKSDKIGNLYAGSFGGGICVYNKIKSEIEVLKNIAQDSNSLSSNFVRTLTLDSKRNLWIGTQNGLNRLDSEHKMHRYFYNNQLEFGDDIATVFEDSKNQIWVGTRYKGLYKFENNEFVRVQLFRKDKEISIVYSIEEDDAQNLWVGTNEGIVKYNTESGKSVLYNQIDGVVSNEFNNNASLKINDSEFCFGGPNGVTIFNTKSLNQNTYSPQVLITGFKINNKLITPNEEDPIISNSISYIEELKLSYDQGNFSIQFAIPNFINEQNNSYQYRLKGLDKEWIATTENNAAYTIQNPGVYVFEIKGVNNDGVSNEKATTLKIYVAPAPWRSWWAFLLYGVLISAALYYLISIQQTKTKLKLGLESEHKENERIEEVNKAKLEFFTNISHEFRTPLTLILGPLHQILDDYKGSRKMYKKMLVIENSAKQLLQLINRLMDFRKLEKNLYQLEAAEGNIVKFLKEIFLSFEEYAKDGKFEYSFHTTNEEILVYYDRHKLERVFYNLLSNAFRYTPKNGKISISIELKNNKVLVSVADSGIGISKENREKIFDRFYEVKSNSKNENYNQGTGIGLSIAKNIVNLHKGKVGVMENPETTGSVFYVELSLGREHLEDDEIIKDFKFSDDISHYKAQLVEPFLGFEDELSDALINENIPTVLIAEDNTALRKFMKNLLKDDYNILEAENGEIAFKKAVKHQPDLIVSDIVMPVMAGTELCHQIKSNVKTCHIPVILLTARTSLVYKLDGLEKGADDYINKPFDVKEFKFRVQNILKSLERLKDKFSVEKNILSSELVVSSLDEKLFKKALEIVEENISNEDFDIPFFCSKLGLSRTVLFVKIKAWTNCTPNEFIQQLRMKRAAQFLEQGKINISEISYKVGFKNPKYFSKCFVKKYGETPTQYSNRFSDDSI